MRCPGQPIFKVARFAFQFSRGDLDADASQLAATLRLPSGVGATCVLLWPLNGSSSILVPSSLANYSDRSLDWDVLDSFEPECRSVFVPGLPLDNFVPPLPTVETPTSSADTGDTTTSPGVTSLPRFTSGSH